MTLTRPLYGPGPYPFFFKRDEQLTITYEELRRGANRFGATPGEFLEICRSGGLDGLVPETKHSFSVTRLTPNDPFTMTDVCILASQVDVGYNVAVEYLRRTRGDIIDAILYAGMQKDLP